MWKNTNKIIKKRCHRSISSQSQSVSSRTSQQQQQQQQQHQNMLNICRGEIIDLLASLHLFCCCCCFGFPVEIRYIELYTLVEPLRVTSTAQQSPLFARDDLSPCPPPPPPLVCTTPFTSDSHSVIQSVTRIKITWWGRTSTNDCIYIGCVQQQQQKEQRQ